MDYNRLRSGGSPVYSRQRSGASSTSTNSSSSPSRSPAHPAAAAHHHHVRSGSTALSNIKRTQNYAAKAAAQCLAQVMASQSNDDDDEDDIPFHYGSTPSSNSYASANSIHNISSSAKATRSPSPAVKPKWRVPTIATMHFVVETTCAPKPSNRAS